MSSPLRILHVSPSYYGDQSVVGGGEKYVIYCAEALRRAGERQDRPVENTALSFAPVESRHVTDTGFPFDLIRGEPWDAGTVNARDLQERLRAADCVHVHQCLSGIGLFVAAHARLLGKTVIGTDHGGGEHPLVPDTPLVGSIYDWLHAQSAFAARSFDGLAGTVHVIPGPVDTERYAPGTRTMHERGAVIAVGRILPHKGFDRIISALPADMALTIVGRPVDGKYLSHLKRLAKGRRVRIRTDVSDDGLVGLIRHASVAVFASTHRDYRGNRYPKPELLGLAPLECLSMGVPTLVSDAGALPELGELPGCRVFDSQEQLTRLLEEHREFALDAATMHDAVAAQYGLLAFGGRLLALLRGDPS
ncbi:glycosyltransferase family 4 protein [bacterium]|nr:glycosyltransferase family 4 protein [bacterium]